MRPVFDIKGHAADVLAAVERLYKPQNACPLCGGEWVFEEKPGGGEARVEHRCSQFRPGESTLLVFVGSHEEIMAQVASAMRTRAKEAAERSTGFHKKRKTGGGGAGRKQSPYKKIVAKKRPAQKLSGITGLTPVTNNWHPLEGDEISEAMGFDFFYQRRFGECEDFYCERKERAQAEAFEDRETKEGRGVGCDCRPDDPQRLGG